MKRALATVALTALALLPGCIIGEIRDELKGVNSNLTTVQTSLEKLDQTNERILSTNDSLLRTNTLIDEVGKGLGRIDSTNASLVDVDKRLMLLASIDKSLTRLDTHLASLRTTINKLDSAIPFLDLGGGDAPAEPAPEPAAAPTESQPETVVAKSAQPSGEVKPEASATAQESQQPAPSKDASPPAAPAEATPAKAGAAKQPPEPLMGTWIFRYPTDGGVFVFLPDKTYILLDPANEPDMHTRGEIRGTWSREGNKLTLTQEFPKRYQRKAGAPKATPEEQSLREDTNPNLEPAPARTRTLEVITSSPRNATVRLDGRLIVLVRPT